MRIITTCAAPILAAHFIAADIETATSAALQPMPALYDESGTRTFVSFGSWDFLTADLARPATSAESFNTRITSSPRHNSLAEQIVNFGGLKEGWDGEMAAQPSSLAIASAVSFANAIFDFGVELDPSPHVDGSVILDISDEGTLRFKGDGTIIYATAKNGYGYVVFDGRSVPAVIAEILAHGYSETERVSWNV